MSSYFDRMGGCIDNPKEFLRLVRDQYRWYLRELNQEVLVKDLDRLNKLIYEFNNKFEKIPEPHGDNYNLHRWLFDMHTFAHDLAMAGIRLKGGRRAGDNPPIPY